MNWYRKNPIFATVLTLCALLVVGEGWLIFDQVMASRDADRKLVNKQAELVAMRDLTPVPSRQVATAIEGDLARAQKAVTVMQAELKGHGPAAEQLAAAKPPTARTEAYFDLATLVEKTRELAKKNDVEIRPEAARLGFSLYANEGPKEDRIPAVFHQRQVIQYVVDALIEARPLAIMAVQRERALNKSEKAAALAALAAAAAAATGVQPPEPPPDAGTGSPAEPDSPDLFEIDPRVTARSPGFIDTTPVKLVFVGQTAALRAFLNKLAAFDLPILVREVEVDRATTEDVTATSVITEDAPPVEEAPAASLVITAPPKVPVKDAASPRPSSSQPIVPKPLSKFTVTVEYIDLVAPASPAVVEAASPAPAPEAKPTT